MRIALTGGHHSSALPVITELKKLDPNLELIWFGHKHTLKGDKNPTLEYKEITTLGIPFINLHAGKVYKTFDLTRLVKVPYGFFEAIYYLVKFKPAVILSFGGYLAVPVAIAGWLFGIPCITHEQTLVVGYANKVIALFAKKILISWRESAKYFPQAKVVFAGIPLREEIFKSTSTSFNISNALPTIYITAGKTGSHKLNEIVNNSLATLLTFCNVILQCGDNSVYNDFDVLTKSYSDLSPKPQGELFLRKFVLQDEIGEAFAKSSLVVSRAGAHIMAELLALKKPAILIPIPWVSYNEQLENAKFLNAHGLGTILEEKDLSVQLFIACIRDALAKSQFFKPIDLETTQPQNSAEIIAHETLKTAHKS